MELLYVRVIKIAVTATGFDSLFCISNDCIKTMKECDHKNTQEDVTGKI